ncbi:MAG: 23S rRNA (adenine(2503)-C(2))-methyltransferase RlmN [Eubacteriales bacterium]
MDKQDILSLLPHELQALMVRLGEPAYRAEQIFAWLHRGKRFAEMTNLPLALREKLEDCCELRLPVVQSKQVSADGTVKYLFALIDGACVESVLMRYKHGHSLCISSQVGCRMGCRFCASTIGGKERDLRASEMLGQVIAAVADSGERVDSIVMMGIGEPLDNYDNTVRFLHLVNHPAGLQIGYRHISLSTCGLSDGILRLAEEGLPITLSVSLHAATDQARSALMPVNRTHPLSRLLSACAAYFDKTGRRISFEYTLLSGVNDRDEDAYALAKLLKGHLGERAPLHVNLIRLNEVAERPLRSSPDSRAARFAARLEQCGVRATLRRRLGTDIDAACGQLRRRQAGASPDGQPPEA